MNRNVTILAVVLIGVLGAGCDPSSSGGASPAPTASVSAPLGPRSCGPQPVTIKLGPNPNHPAGANRCDVMAVKPHVVEVCPGDEITWKVVNDCGTTVDAQIGTRTRLYPKGGTQEPLAVTTNLQPLPFPVPAASAGVAGNSSVSAKVSSQADDGLYKYTIEGQDIATDPEIDVRRGNGLPPPPPPMGPRPSPSPSPGANRP